MLVELVLSSCTVGHITACDSRHDIDIHLIHRRPWPKSDRREKQFSSLCIVCRLPRLHGSGAGIPGIGILINSWYCGLGISSGDGICSRSRDAETSVWRAHGQQMIESASTVIKHCDERSSVGTRWSRKNDGDSRCRNRAQRTWESESQSRAHLAKTLTIGIPHSTDTRVRSILPILPCWRQRDNLQQWWWRLHHTNSSLQHCCTSLTMLTQKGAREVVRKAGNNVFEAYRHLCLMYGTSDQEGSTGLFLQTMTYSLVPRLKTRKTVWIGFLELVRRYDEVNGTDPVPDQVKKACIISKTPEPPKTHVQLSVGKLGNFNALRVATEDYLRSRRIFNTTSAGNTHDEDSMEVDAVSRKGKGKEKSSRGKKGGKKGKEIPLRQGLRRQQNTHDSMENAETIESMDHKASDCWYKQTNKSQGKGKGQESRNPRWQKSVRVTTVNKSMIGIQFQTRPHSSQIYLKWTRLDAQMRDSGYFHWKTARNVGARWIGYISLVLIRLRSGKTEEHDLAIESGCFGHVCPPWFAPHFQWWVLQNVDAVEANNVALQHYGQKVVYRHVMTNSGKTNLDPDHTWRDERAQTSPEHFCT